MSKFKWNKETIQHFRFQSNYINEKQMRESVKDFVECDCVPEEGETEEDLINNLIEQIYN
jgi:hypothetical protein